MGPSKHSQNHPSSSAQQAYAASGRSPPTSVPTTPRHARTDQIGRRTSTVRLRGTQSKNRGDGARSATLNPWTGSRNQSQNAAMVAIVATAITMIV